MQGLEIEAVYEHGTLKLPRTLPLPDGQKVTITIHSANSAVQRRARRIHWKGSQQDLDSLILADDNDPLEAP